MNTQKGFILPLIIVVVVIALLGGACYFVYQNYSMPKQVACTLEAKICPDGSFVGRTGPNCEFAQCPETQDQTTDCSTLYWFDNTSGDCQTLKQFCGAYMYHGLKTFNSQKECLNGLSMASGKGSWTTYKSEKWGFQVDYPSNWTIKDYEKSWGGANWHSPISRPEDVFIEIGIFPSATFGNLVDDCPTTSTTDEVIGKVQFNGLEFCKVLNKGGTDSNPPKGTQVITYSIVNSVSGYKITLNILGGNQTMDSYLPESEFTYESSVINQMLSTFKFTN